MLITDKIFEAFLHCETKAFLYLNGETAERSEIVEWRGRLKDEFNQRSRERLLSNIDHEEWTIGTPSVARLKEGRYKAIFDYEATSQNVRSRVQLVKIRARRKQRLPYGPIRFVTHHKIGASDKLLVAFDALALVEGWHKAPAVGQVLHGSGHAIATFRLAGLLSQAKRVLTSITTKFTTDPPAILKKHCMECEFQSRCMRLAVEKDDLSLLGKLSEKERRRQHDKGVFTITQLSYTFRPRRRSPKIRFDQALRALAIRKNQIHIFGTPAFTRSGTSVYFDVEGDTDRDFYYLIGLRICSDGGCVQQSFWADDPRGERGMWVACLDVLSGIPNPQLIHYGSYETHFLQRMKARYPDAAPSFSEQLISSALNLLSIIYARIYFPTRSNSLKEIAGYLGFNWSEKCASGLSALMWRSQWESDHSPQLKQKLIRYNAEDCQAAQRVTDAMDFICRPQRDHRPDVVDVDSLKKEYPQRFGTNEFHLPEFRRINDASYWDYQRAKVYVRTGHQLKPRRRSRKAELKVPINKTVVLEEERPRVCRKCNNARISKNGRFYQVIYDLKFSAAGIKRWVVRYSFDRYRCPHCNATCFQHEHQNKYGDGLRAYVLYLVVEMLMSQGAVASSFRLLFGLPVTREAVHSMKTRGAESYAATYQNICGRIASGKLVHADETQVQIGGSVRYVWVFTNMEDVAFVFSDTREAATPREFLKDFRGVLVSDFYSGYDSLDCAQQKCLIHIIRDINDDLSKHSFNHEMKELAQEFATLVQAMVESVDRFGLKSHHLQKHKKSVDGFYKRIEKRDYKTEIAGSYKKRFAKNRDRLFTFLDYDGIPWNNNNAEHAIKAFARLRRNIGGTSTSAGIREYLILLSISQTCRYRELNFLEFLQSGEKDVAAFAAKRKRSRPS